MPVIVVVSQDNKPFPGGKRVVLKHFDTTGMTPSQITDAIDADRTTTFGASAPATYYTTPCGMLTDYPVTLREYPLIAALWAEIVRFYAATSNIIWLDLTP